MKASEMLVLGSMLMRPQAGTVFAHGPMYDVGCAVGMIAAGGGHLERLKRGGPIEAYLPQWLLTRSVPYPCNCQRRTPWSTPSTNTVCSVIIHLFDFHVMGGDPETWSFERLVDWLRSQEPAELPALAASLIGKPEPELVYVDIPAELEKPALELVGT